MEKFKKNLYFICMTQKSYQSILKSAKQDECIHKQWYRSYTPANVNVCNYCLKSLAFQMLNGEENVKTCLLDRPLCVLMSNSECKEELCLQKPLQGSLNADNRHILFSPLFPEGDGKLWFF